MAGILSKQEKEERLRKVRERMSQSKGSRKDPNEFRPPKADEKEILSFYFRVLPELNKGEKCESGVASRDYDYFFYKHGAHWINKKKHECPRLHDETECPICELGFDLMQQAQGNDDERKEISKRYLPRTYYSINAYFLNIPENVEDVRGKVMWISVGKQVFDKFDECICNDDPGSELDPKAYGAFYDCEEGYVFKMDVRRKGDWNTYEQSEFLVKSRQPLVKDDKGELDIETAQGILDQRFDLVAKFPERDMDKLKKIVKAIAGGDDDFDVDEEKEEKEEKEATTEISEEPKTQKTDSISEEPKKEESKKKEEPKAEKPKDEPEATEDDDEELANLLDEIKSSS